MSLMKAADVAYVRFRVPDLNAAEKWYRDFGLLPAMRDEGHLFLRGSGPDPFIFAAELGPPAFLGFGIKANGLADLRAIAEREAAHIEPLQAPGGGQVVRLTDPDGHRVEIVAVRETAARPRMARAPLNSADRYERVRKTKRLGQGPSEIVRLGHVVLGVSDFRRSEAWYKERFGFLTSDEVGLPDGSALGAFLRCDRGDQPTDHHTLFLLQASKPGFNHAAFEVRDFDDLMSGNGHLTRAGYSHRWGVGRHVLGSQIFDYWNDPWGNAMEHWTDGDLFTADQPPARATMADLLGAQWGPAFPGEL